MIRTDTTRPEASRVGPSLMAAVIFLCLASHSTTVTAQAPPAASEQQVKAAYLYKFAAYVEWPETLLQGPDSPLSIGVLGARSLGDELARLTANRTVGAHPIRVRQVTEDDGFEGIQILFVAGAQHDELPRLALVAQARSILIVTESDDALRHGSVINFTTSDHRIRFEVSLDAAAANQLKLSSRLLAVAENVQSSAM